MDPKQQNQNLDDALRAMRETEPAPSQTQASLDKVFRSLTHEQPARIADRLRTEEDFQNALPLYLRNEVSEARRMLIEDHLSKSPAARRRLEELRGNVRAFAPVGNKAARRSPARAFVPWAVAAALIIGTGYFALDTIDRLFAPSGARAEIASASGEIFKVSAAGLEPLRAGAQLNENESLRTAKGSAAVVRLPDGSLIEMNERAELSISAAYSGNTIRLERGNIVVQAAKQKRGSLKVATRESTVSVKGTIFSVAAGLRGTQVAVVEGHVVVDQNGNVESLLPGQVTGSDANLRRTTVNQQFAWSKDSAKYLAMLGELQQISKQVEALQMPSLRMEAKLLDRLPQDTVVYAAIPNVSGTIADASRIFEDRFRQSPVLKEWWNTAQVAEMRAMAEKLRTVGAQIGDEIVIAAPRNSRGGIGEPFLIAEVKGAAARTALESSAKELLGGGMDSQSKFTITDRYLVAGATIADTPSGFAATPFGESIRKSYAKGAGWILSLNLEQILPQSVSSNTTSDVEHQKDNKMLSLTGANQMRHLTLERRDLNGRSDTRATLNFTTARTGIASWLAAPAPMPSLDYVSPDAGFAMAAVTKDARSMAEEFFGVIGNGTIDRIQREIGVNVIDDLAGPLGGETTFAVDGALVPVPAWIAAVEVYDSGRLSTTLRRIVDAVNARATAAGAGSVSLTEQAVSGRTWFTIKSSMSPMEIHFTYANGYVLIAGSRDQVSRALLNRQNGTSLPRSQQFRSLLPLDNQVNSSGVFYYNLGSSLKGIASSIESSVPLPTENKTAISDLIGASGPVLICAYAFDDELVVASTSGFFGFGLDTLLAAGRGAPILPQLLSSAMRSGRQAAAKN